MSIQINRVSIEIYQEADNDIGSKHSEIIINPALIGLFEEVIFTQSRYKGQIKPHSLEGKLVGRIFWKEVFTDEDTGNPIEIERSQIVYVDEKWYGRI